jgi:hypothetical protein
MRVKSAVGGSAEKARVEPLREERIRRLMSFAGRFFVKPALANDRTPLLAPLIPISRFETTSDFHHH